MCIRDRNMEDAVKVRNAFNEEYTHMRRSLAPRLLESASENLKHREAFSFFEIGKIYTKNPFIDIDNSLLQKIAIKPFPEKKIIAWVSVGSDIEALRKTLESYLHETLGYIPPAHTGTSKTFLHPGISGRYMEWESTIIEFGVLHPEVATLFGLPEDTLYFEADFHQLCTRYSDRETRFSPISRYQIITRELNFIMDTKTPTAEVARIIDSVHPWIHQVIVDSVYSDEGKIGIGKKSVNFSFILSNHDDTISDVEALEVQNKIIEALKTHGYELRSI